MPEPSLILEKRGRIAHLTLARPERGNLIDGEMVRALRSHCDAIREDQDVRVVVLAGTGGVFSSGWDWAALAGESASGEELLEAARLHGLLEDPFGCLAELPKAVICAIGGDALGGGLALALACDIRIAAEGARLALPETQMGLLPMGGAMQRLVRLAGRGRALQMVLTAEPLTADEALRAGLVSGVAPRDRLPADAEALAQRIAEMGPLAVQYAKEAVLRGIDMPLEQALRFETDLTIILQTTEDRADGVRAFLEKRKPEFKGR
jgi:enoyl-CoA hydratase